MGFSELLLYASPIFILSMWIEYKLSKHLIEDLYSRSDFYTNIRLGLGGLFFGAVSSSLAMLLYYVCFHFFSSFRVHLFGYHEMGWGIGAWIACLLVDDFTYYWFHRSSHTVRLFWASHVVHHSSEHFNFSIAVRNGWFSYAYKPLFWVWMAVMGFHPLMILTCLSINNIYGFFCHTVMLPWWNKLSGVLVTPGLHAIHHGQEDRSIDKNYAGVFILYDRLFGTYEPINPSLKPIFGVTKPPRSNRFYEVMVHEFRDLMYCMKKTRSWKLKLMYLFKRPGWSPEKL